MDVIALEGNGARPSHQGGGYSEEGKMFTLNTIEHHAVCYAVDPVICIQGGGKTCMNQHGRIHSEGGYRTR